MAIQSRRGAYGDFDPNKMLPGEWASVLKDDPKAQDGKSVYMCFSAGDVKRMATYEDMKDNIKEATGDVVQEVTEEYAGEIKAATKAANDAASAAESATSAANTATGSANTAASSATAAAKVANDAAKNVKNDFYGAYADFPETGEENKMYIDTSSNPNKIYTWDSASASYKLVSGGSEENPTYDVTLTLPVSGWVGDSAPYAQTVASAGMTADKSLVFAMISAGPVPTDAEYEAYGKLTGVAQGVNSVTFYCNEKPTTELKIRAFCGAGSDEGTDLSIIGEGFNANKSYAIGDYCVNESSLWEFTAAKGTGAWDSSKVTQRSVIGLIQSLQSRVSTLETQVSSLNANLTVLDPKKYTTKLTLLPSIYYEEFGDSTDTTDYLKNYVKHLVKNYPSSNVLFGISEINPNSRGILIIQLYDVKDFNKTGFPRYGSGTYFGLGTNIIRFEIYEGTFNIRTI